MQNTSKVFLKRDYSFLRRLLMRAISKKMPIKMLVHCIAGQYTFSLQAGAYQECWPWLVSTKEVLFFEAETFLAEYPLIIANIRHEQETIELQICC
jgi:hypothetical protein